MLSFGGVEFVLDTRPGPQRAKSSGNRFVLVKSRQTLSFYDRLRERQPKEILEIGIFQGGSLVYFDKLFAPTCLVGIDLKREPIAALERYREGKPYIKTFYGRSQDKVGTRAAAQSSFPRGIDLVVDDASHNYAKTKATFESIFPLVRPGGHYVIEDWAWSHRPNAQQRDAPWSSEPALTNLVFNLVVLTAVSRVITSIYLSESVVCVEKGRGMLPKAKLEVDGYLRGKALAMI